MFKESKLIISTGNILNITKKAGQKGAEELLDCLQATVDNASPDNLPGKITRNNDDLLVKLSENKREEIKIGAKVFINNSSVSHLKEAIDQLFITLNVQHLDNLILAFHPRQPADEITNGHAENGDAHLTNGSAESTAGGGGVKENVIQWGTSSKNALTDLKTLWKVLEEYGHQKKISQLGIADLDIDSLINLWSTCEIRPTIAQINLSACCVVPPALQQFCNENEIQLLTHSDPQETINESTLSKINLEQFKATWSTRYQVHVKCRGVLSAKGYIVAVAKDE